MFPPNVAFPGWPQSLSIHSLTLSFFTYPNAWSPTLTLSVWLLYSLFSVLFPPTDLFLVSLSFFFFFFFCIAQAHQENSMYLRLDSPCLSLQGPCLKAYAATPSSWILYITGRTLLLFICYRKFKTTIIWGILAWINRTLSLLRNENGKSGTS